MTPLRQPAFRRLWLAGLISDTGDWLLLVSLPILVFQLTGSTLGTSIAFLIELVPGVLVAPLAGRLADRMDRRRLLVIISLAQAAALLPLLAGARLPVVYAVIAVQAALASMFDPAKNALLPTLVDKDQLVAANSLVGLNQNLGRLIGAALGGLLLAAGELPAIVLADAVSFLAAVVLIVRLRAGSPPVTGPLAAAAPGHPFTRRPVRAGLAVIAVTMLGQGLFVVLFVVFVAQVLHGGPAENGLLRGVQAIGAIGGGLLLATTRRRSPARLAGFACLTFGLLVLVTWNLPRLTRAEPVYLMLFIAVGVPAVAMVTGLLTALQESTVDGERGPVFAAVGVASATGQAVGMLAAGFLGDRLGVVGMLNGQAVLYLLAGAIALLWLSPTRRSTQQSAQPATEPTTEPTAGLSREMSGQDYVARAGNSAP
jgi:MFS family permease